jgi:hypothetical protein
VKKTSILVATWVLVLVGMVAPSAGAAPRSQAVAPLSGPCGTATSATYTHVLWIWMENHSYNTIIGSSQAPYINSLANECGLATNYHNITHPSLPNYVSATSGLPLSKLGPFTPDCNPVPGCTTTAKSIFAQGESWKAYQESMPSNCFKSNSGEYAVRHDPPPYYTTLKGCKTFDVPYSQLASNLSAGKLPAFSFVTPNLIDDMHDGTVQQGDTWLSNNLPVILNSSVYTSDHLVVMITWDEGENGTSNNCARNTTDVGCHVATIVVSPTTTAGTKSSTLFNHWSLLRTTEDLLKLPALGKAATSTSMVSAFRL